MFTLDLYPHPHPRPLPASRDPRPATFRLTLVRGIYLLVNNRKEYKEF